MNARSKEAKVIERCVQVVRDDTQIAYSEEDAQVLRIAATLLVPTHPDEADKLFKVSESYLIRKRHTPTSVKEAIARGWIISLPRMKRLLQESLKKSFNIVKLGA